MPKQSDRPSIENMIHREAMKRLGSAHTKAWNMEEYQLILTEIARGLSFFLSYLKTDQIRMQVATTTFQYIADQVQAMAEERGARDQKFIGEIDMSKMQ